MISSVSASKSIVPFIPRSANPFQFASTFFENTRRRVHNVFSQYFLEPRLAALQAKESQRRNAHVFKAYNHLMHEISPNDRPRFYCKSPSFNSEEILNSSFEKEDAFSVLREVQPGVAKETEWRQLKKGLSISLSAGTCYGESLVTLKLSSLFPLEGPLRDTIQNKYSSIIGFIQLTGILSAKWLQALNIKEMLENEGASLDRLVSKNGVIDQAQLFYYLSKANPSLNAHQVRICMSFFLAEDFSFTKAQITQKIFRLNTTVTAFMGSSYKHSDLPLLPRRTWHSGQKITESSKSEIGFIEKTKKKVEEFFLHRQGSFVLTAWSENEGHAVFVKKEAKGVLFYDPLLKLWMRFDNPKRAIPSLLHVLFTTILPQEKIVVLVDTLE